MSEIILVQWFFTIWLAGIPHKVGPFVTERHCDNTVQGYMDGGPFVDVKPNYQRPAYRPQCVKHSGLKRKGT